MPALAVFLMNVFAGAIEWLARYLTQKIAVALPVIAIVGGLATALYAGLRALYAMAVINLAGVHPSFAVGVSVVMPPHTVSLITAYFTFWSLTEVYKWKINLLSIWSRTT